MFDIVPDAAIEQGRATDAYFLRTEEALEHAGRDPEVVAEVTADQFPTGEFELLAGVADAARLLAGRDVDADALPEGTLFDGGPVLRIEGPYLEFCRLETALLGFLSHPTAMATAALGARRAAPEASLLSFGARHVHPAVAGTVDRSALIGGFDGFSHVAAGELMDRAPSGTMPHALMLCFGAGNQEEAWRAFDDAVGPDVPRIALCDTYDDEVDEAVRAAELGFDSVRLDTTGSRRGDLRHIVRETRWKLNERGHGDVDVLVSGGITPAEIRRLADVVDGFGVGSHVTNADPVDFALDIVEVDGTPTAKRGKLSGKKEVYRTPDGGHHVALADDEGQKAGEALLEPLVRDGEVVAEFDVDAAAKRASADAEAVGFGETGS
ncbi:nicotinate phosphoribosyltransferase [Natronomonas sp.]|uniref:nicotinate phosphoribosyltransferase n=1 Tax=Natronomonas sp. TaxID=2184060 RepID=UPI002624CB6A|nr:nicotinate phosphoribosyltransferase [Natronomonas sp.]